MPGKLQNMAELIVEFIRGIILDTMGEAGNEIFPLIATLFLFILFANLLSLIPGSYTAHRARSSSPLVLRWGSAA